VWAAVSTLHAFALTATAAILSGAVVGYAIAISRVRRLRRSLRRAEHHLIHDPLTGLRNRSVLHQHVADRRPAEPVVFALLNLDDFAAINEQVGYRGGDELLVLLAGGLRHRAKTCGGAAFRLGRDEFAFVLPEQSGTAEQLAAQLLAVVNEPVELLAGRSPVTVAVRASVGLVTAGPHRGLSVSVLLRRADQALQHAKRHHRGHACVWTPELAAAPMPRRRDRTHPTTT
jgi:diguanylate cyclase (GGDEF)-like protein